jgi:hypothetical protein
MALLAVLRSDLMLLFLTLTISFQGFSLCHKFIHLRFLAHGGKFLKSEVIDRSKKRVVSLTRQVEASW